jgi:hypothetical protein
MTCPGPTEKLPLNIRISTLAALQGMGASMDAMMVELDRHRVVACASTTDLIPNEAEAQQHVATMTRWASHEIGRSHDLASMAGMGMGGMGSGTTGGRCVHNADGSYTLHP